MKIQYFKKKKTKSIIFILLILNIVIYKGIQLNSPSFNITYTDKTNNVRSSDWKEPITRNVDSHPYSVFVGDANNDGFNDIVTADFWSDWEVGILIWNNAIKDWNPLIQRNIGPHPVFAVIGDANNDGYNDIVGGNLNWDELGILLWNDTIGDWNPKITKIMGDYPYSVYVGDVNDDSYNDIVSTSYRDDDISILTWNDTLKDWNSRLDVPVGIDPNSVHINDADNDGKNEMVISNEEGTVSILSWNNISKTWDTDDTLVVGDSPKSVISDDVNNDGYNDIVVACEGDDQVSILLWNEAYGDWDLEIRRDVSEAPRSVHVGDANNDGFNDIATANRLNNSVSILCWNDLLGDWNPEVTKAVGVEPSGIFINDADNDGKNDVVASNQIDYTVSILSWTLDAPLLEQIAPNPDNDGSITLNWNHVHSATIYYIYRSNHTISSIENMTILSSIITNTYSDMDLTDGEYYYLVVAGDNVRNSTTSNVVSVTVSISGGNEIAGYSILHLLFSSMVLIFIILKKLRNLKRNS